jgi:threonylcarbamoyladenosine tRNA methylthiotransferase MtaB
MNIERSMHEDRITLRLCGPWVRVRSVYIHTLGCRVNQYDSQVLRELAGRAGYAVVPDPSSASAIVLDACAVTAAADADARRLLRRFRRANPKALLALVGCLPPGAPDLPADLILSNPDKFTVFERLLDAKDSNLPFLSRERERKGKSHFPSPPWGTGQGEGEAPRHWPLRIRSFAGHRRPILKVQDGCRFACSYCIVPSRRGRAVSRPPAEVIEEARLLADGGARELVLAGVHLSSYGRDLGLAPGAPRLAPLVESLLKVPGVRRVRLSSYGVADYEEGLLSLVGWEDGLCPHFHLPLQSGDEGVLRAMGRPYTLARFRRVVQAVRRRVPGAGLTTDVIAGFPGETERAFRNTLDRLSEFGFRDLHAFPYSERPGTPAAGRGSGVPGGVVRERMESLSRLKRRLLEASARELEGKVRLVVAESHSPGMCGGTTPEGAKVVFRGGEGLVGRETWVRLGEFSKGQIRASRVE